MNLAGVILAAGASSRMGSPKALLDLHGETFLDRLIGIFAPHCSEVIVVLGHEPGAIRRGLRREAQATIVVNDWYERGQLSSLQCGLAAAPAEAEAVLFTPVDYPGIRSGTVARLREVFEQRRPLLAIPRCQGRRGHPVLCARELISEFLALPPDSDARAVVRRHVAETCYVEVEDPGIIEDVDDPAAYARLLERQAPR